ncbi:hypothetical protein Xph01_43500 [Micromonospora phaseoli]|nr:hypothetical protein Xph01_43500 [Micromonospora phaseoli]
MSAYDRHTEPSWTVHPGGVTPILVTAHRVTVDGHRQPLRGPCTATPATLDPGTSLGYGR